MAGFGIADALHRANPACLSFAHDFGGAGHFLGLIEPDPRRGANMNDANGSRRGDTAILGTLLAIGLILGGWTLGAQIKATRLGDRYVSVRGLAERTVKSDLAIWTLTFSETGDDLPSLSEKIEADQKVVLQYLYQQGLQPPEITLGIVSVTDNQANQYANNRKPEHRYVVQQYVNVETPRVDQVETAAQNSVSLLQKGVVLVQNTAPTFKFNGLNSIKPDMITEATRNARSAAERFALDAGSSVGTIRQASQGVFSILAADSGTPADTDEPTYGNNADSSLMKTVRVVTEVQYYLGK
jgi:uncharacterized protein